MKKQIRWITSLMAMVVASIALSSCCCEDNRCCEPCPKPRCCPKPCCCPQPHCCPRSYDLADFCDPASYQY